MDFPSLFSFHDAHRNKKIENLMKIRKMVSIIRVDLVENRNLAMIANLAVDVLKIGIVQNVITIILAGEQNVKNAVHNQMEPQEKVVVKENSKHVREIGIALFVIIIISHGEQNANVVMQIKMELLELEKQITVLEEDEEVVEAVVVVDAVEVDLIKAEEEEQVVEEEVDVVVLMEQENHLVDLIQNQQLLQIKK
jgi:hypothetical protein